MDAPVTLIIKAPNQKYRDQTISCFLDWTVGRLKTHLADVYPSRPQDEYHMVHLVCTSRTPPSSPKPSTSRENHGTAASSSSSNSDHSGSTTPSSSQETLSATSSSGSEGLRQRSFPQAQTTPVQSHQFPYVMQGNVGNQFPGQAVPAGFPMYPAFSPLQMLWWQQMYARQYYMQYQAAVSAQATSNADPARPSVAQPVNLAPAPVNDPPPAPNGMAQENRPGNPNVQMNAQGGAIVNEEDVNRDWLDWMYTFSRAAILLSIVYFYSSFSRFVMVMGAMLLVYLHQAGWFPFRQEGGRPQAPNNNAEVNPGGQNLNDPDLEEMERLMDEGVDDDSGEDAIEDANTVPQPGFMASAWSFITTFFTSLIPEGPPQVVN
ncbi:homocysteine-responsive endoplasmic reticulum-resident ubiquitin-like domain member 2 protein isoform X2 [Ornithorhynchus anatinus]|uniref:homocysteine-responsive endoplasmic reticulum-resident ubiquitin-like domain member 2 protein isoform X2 n=1 Tax=Ornithorhynchus anatinus TaxID=9258 RepID=UPI0010A7A1CA|nr:homocysteine-responsive endoplasmic reticulum-resident ubiquitin-like domain member 2 protein isoform X2 [Ornithorhynchus anatinus]